jgi:predicted nucleic acid-binding protein
VLGAPNGIARRIITLDFNVKTELPSLLELMGHYESVPMSLADACLVRMAEISPVARILTLDGDFRIYRKHRTETIALIAPFA